ncbi:hypothetical protein [Chryseobacterium aurantiacum]|uniref:hypothetical protein n=1 Tax=Chryseobacterium aurantiacum TaxID=2116499 RepID=UPI0013C42035|nr:hypothetical protein [Chryseobacterium aurantiacum]
MLFVILLTTTVINAQIKKVPEKYKAAVETIFKAFKNHDYNLLKPLLDSNVKVGTLPTGMNDKVVAQVVEKFPVPELYSVVGMVTEGENERVKTLYKFSDAPENRSLRNKSVNRSFLFNKDGKIIDLDVFEGITATSVRKQ